ncbi:acyltransferase domain-containing protein, partial [Streptomyces sparsogenes]|uniref:acyltransferase domain-containing protein n=3 Tax=Streptomyces sparsogenes TaxID=67365 RepID=UPI00384CC94D
GMASVAAGVERVAGLIEAWSGRVSVAAVNGPATTVISGDRDALAQVIAGCEELGVRARWIAVDYASHSPHVDAVRDQLLEALAPVSPRAGDIPVWSAVDEELVDGSGMDAEYWYRNLRQPVRFAPVVAAALEAGHGAFVEVSPHPVITASIQETTEALDIPAVVTGSLRRDQGGSDQLALSLAELAVHGTPVDWDTVYHTPHHPWIDLPTYAFQHQRYWPQPKSPQAMPTDPGGARGDADARLWEMLESGDLPGLAGALGLEGTADIETLKPMVSALASWRRAQRQKAEADSWYYRVVWAPVVADGPAGPSGRWLVAAPHDRLDHPVVQLCTRALTAHGAEAVSLPIADLGSAAVRRQLQGTLHGLTSPPNRPVAGVLSLLALTRGTDSLAATSHLLRALDEHHVSAPVWLITHNAVSTAPGDPAPDPRQAALWGLAQNLGIEGAPGRGGVIDLPAGARASAAAALARVLTGGAGADQTAVRDSGVFARRLAAAPRRDGGSPELGGTTLIVGGSDPAAEPTVRWLASRGAEHLLVVVPEGEEPDASRSRAAADAAGAEVTLLSCDLADRTALAEVLAKVPGERPLRRVLCFVPATAASTGGRPVGDPPPPDESAGRGLPGPDELTHALTAPARHLDALTWDMDLRSFVVCVPFAGFLGVPDHGWQAPAAAALDALVERRRAQGRAASLLALGPWAEDADGAGADGPGVDGFGSVLGGWQRPLPRRLAGTVLERALLEGHGESLAFADVQWGAVADYLAERPSTALFDGIPQIRDRRASAMGNGRGAQGLERTIRPERLAALSDEGRYGLLLGAVREQLAAVLGHDGPDSIGPKDGLRELGLESVTAVELRRRLAVVTGLTLPATVAFDFPTPAALAEHLVKELLRS